MRRTARMRIPPWIAHLPPERQQELMLDGLPDGLRTTEDEGELPVNLLVGLLRAEDQVNLLVGLLRAADCEKHPGDCPLEKQAPEIIRRLIAQLGRLGDVDHGRVERAFGYALSGGKKYKDLRNMYGRWRRRTD